MPRLEFVSYEVGLPYDSLEEYAPDVDSVGLMFEGTPVYKIWLSRPTHQELTLLQGACTHIGLSSSSGEVGSMPFFVFEKHSASIRIQAPMCSSPTQVDRWAKGNSNIFVFVVMDLHSLIVRSITTLGIPNDFKRNLVDLWSSGNHMGDFKDSAHVQDSVIAQSKSGVASYSKLWRYNGNSEFFEKIPGSDERESADSQTVVFEMRKLQLAKGERIQFTRRVRRLGIPAFALGTIAEFDQQGNATVVLDERSRIVTFNVKNVPHIDYGYSIGSAEQAVKSVQKLLLDEENDTKFRHLISGLLQELAYIPLVRRPLGATA